MKIIDDKIAYLKGLYDEENDRQKVVEGKCGQIIANSGIFLSLIGLLITILFNAKDAIHPAFKVIVTLAITAIIVQYIISMVNALKSIDPFKYFYSRGDPDTVGQFTDSEKFKEQLVKDYLHSIKNNYELNSRKLELLSKARRAFVSGIYTTGGLTFLLMGYLAFFYINEGPKIQKVEIVAIKPQLELIRISKSLESINDKALDANDIKKVLLLVDSLRQKKHYLKNSQ